MTDDRSGNLVERWRQGDQQAAAELFQRYTQRLIALARSRMPGTLAQRLDPEDVVQSVYRSFFAGARDGHYDLRRGGDLWRLLVSITLNKLYNQVDRETAQKRSVEREQNFGTEDSLVRIQPEVLAQDPSPVTVAALADDLEMIMRGLDRQERRILELRLQGYNLEEVAARVGCCERTVIRALHEIKRVLEQWRARQAAL